MGKKIEKQPEEPADAMLAIAPLTRRTPGNRTPIPPIESDRGYGKGPGYKTHPSTRSSRKKIRKQQPRKTNSK
jgi:hypothetical protein